MRLTAALRDSDLPRSVCFFKNIVERFRDVPAGIVASGFAQIADVTDMVALAILVHVFVFNRASAQILDVVEGFENRTTVLAPAAQVIDFGATRILPESEIGRASCRERV